MAYFVLELEEQYHEHQTLGQYFIEADGRQMVKYAYHYIQKDCSGFNPVWASGDKHLITFDGWHTDIANIFEVTDPVEINVLREYLPHWPEP